MIYPDNDIYEDDDTTLVTNFQKSQLSKYKQAVAMYKDKTGDDSLYIEDCAYWCDGTLDASLSSLHTTRHHDLSEFWRIFDSLN